MKENTTAKVIKMIGIATIVIAVIGAIIAGNETSNELMPIVLVVSGVISGLMFIGFGEIISLLQKNVSYQESILKYLKNKASKENRTSKTVLQDIEDNLPNL